jgi:hypothetical protein
VMNFLAVYYYTRNRSSFYSSEIVLIGAIATIPAILLYYLLLKRAVLASH